MPSRNNPIRPLKLVLTIALLFVLGAGALLASAQSDNRPFLGILTRVTADGTEVVGILPGSPGEAAGFQVGDLILNANGETVLGDNTLEKILGKLQIGATVKFVVLRKAKAFELTAILAARPTGTPGGAAPAATQPAANPTALPASAGLKAFMGVQLKDSADGIRVVGVVPGGPADLAKVQIDDIFVSIDGQPVPTTVQSQAILDSKKPGDTITIAVRRAGQDLTLQVQLTARPANSPLPTAPANGAGVVAPCTPEGPRVQLGVTYEIVTDKLVAERKLSVDHGALVTDVAAKSPADVAGIKAGDVIIEVEGDKVDAKRTLALRMMPYSTGDTITLVIMRGADKLSVSVTLASGGSA